MVGGVDLGVIRPVEGCNGRDPLLTAILLVLVIESSLPLRLAIVTLLSLVLLSLMPARFRPPLFFARYSHTTPRLAQREHVGFSLGHFDLLIAQAWQLSRSLGPAEALAGRLGLVEDGKLSSFGGGFDSAIRILKKCVVGKEESRDE